MPQFKQGDAVRTKRGGGPNMTVDGYTASGEVICTSWIKGRRQQDHFVEATLELVLAELEGVGVPAVGREARRA